MSLPDGANMPNMTPFGVHYLHSRTKKYYGDSSRYGKRNPLWQQHNSTESARNALFSERAGNGTDSKTLRHWQNTTDSSAVVFSARKGRLDWWAIQHPNKMLRPEPAHAHTHTHMAPCSPPPPTSHPTNSFSRHPHCIVFYRWSECWSFATSTSF